jgi:hypothetical protein
MRDPTGEQMRRKPLKRREASLARLRVVRVGTLAVALFLLMSSGWSAWAATGNWVSEQHGAAR